jgi:dTDP-4-dehydrorhamnose reductase
LNEKVLITGGQSMLAGYLARTYGDLARRFTRTQLDIGDPDAFSRELERNEYRLVINTAGYAGSDRRRLFDVNASFPAEIAGICAEKNIPFVFLSTGRVFDGNKGEAYIEMDGPNPLDDYGLSKYVGEKLIENGFGSKKYYIFRLAQLLGIRHRNSEAQGVNSLIERALAGQSVSVADDIISTPAYAADIAGMIKDLTENGLPPGLYHVTTRGSASLYDLVCLINEQFGQKGEIRAVKHKQLGLPGRRALNTSLGSVRAPIGPQWQKSCSAFVRELKQQITPFPSTGPAGEK